MMGGEAVPQHVGRDVFGDAGGLRRRRDDALNGARVDRSARAFAGKEPFTGPMNAQVFGDAVKQRIRKGHESIFAPLAGVHVQQAARSVDVDAAQTGELKDAQSAGIGDGDDEPVAIREGGAQQGAHLALREDDGHFFRSARAKGMTAVMSGLPRTTQ